MAKPKTLSEDEKRLFAKQWQLRQGYTGTPVESYRYRILVGLLLIIGAILTALCFEWIGR